MVFLVWLLGMCAVMVVVELLRLRDGMYIRGWVVAGLCLAWPVCLPLLLSILVISARQAEEDAAERQGDQDEKEADEEGTESVT